MKTRTFQEHNYRALYHNGKTLRLAIDGSKPIGELAFPEFMDVKITSHCTGNCSYCYQSSTDKASHHIGLVKRFTDYFSEFSAGELPFQLAFGGGEPTGHPEFAELMAASLRLGMVPNYTTNGTWALTKELDVVLEATSLFCGGVAVSSHAHLDKAWRSAVDALLEYEVHTNIHVIIGNRESIDRFTEIYREYTGRVKYFVLLPLSAHGRSSESFSDWDYLSASIEGSPRDIAFGANFHPYLSRDKGRFNVSIYEPESMSAYLDLETMKVFRSSFSDKERLIPIGKKVIQ